MGVPTFRGVSSLAKDLEALLHNEAEYDLTIRAGTGEDANCFRAHAAIVYARCKHKSIRQQIESCLKDREEEGRAPVVVHIDAVERSVFAHVLRYVYTGKIRLNSSRVCDVFLSGSRLGIESLMKTCIRYITRTGVADIRNLCLYYDKAVLGGIKELTILLQVKFLQHFQNIIHDKSFLLLSPQTIDTILIKEDLNASEAEIWTGLMRWARHQLAKRGISVNDEYSEDPQISPHYRQELKTVMEPVFHLGRFRLMNLDAETVASQVEPEGVISRSELLKKYRFDAVGYSVPFSLAFPHPLREFAARKRKCSLTYESTHPHARGENRMWKIEMPTWATHTTFTFQHGCELAKYADLTMHLEESLTTTVASLTKLLKKNEEMRELHRSPIVTITLPHREIWCRFYSTHFYKAMWGYTFTVTPEQRIQAGGVYE